MKKTVFIKNAAILTASALILRLAGIIFKIWIAKLIGSEGVGLYQLIFSFYMLAATFATSGISTAVTRLVAEELALGSKRGILKIFYRCVGIISILAAISLVTVFFAAEFIAETLIGDIRALSALKILSFSLPFMGISSCLRGYFIAVRRVTPNALSQIFEQGIRILLIFILVKKYIVKGLSAACAAVLFGDAAAELLACSLLFLVFLKDTNKLNTLTGRAYPNYGVTRKITHIALPITSGRYLNTALRTAENVLVPKNLARFPLSGANSLSQFGMIKGMALPILFFPSTLLNSISTLLIPEMSESAAKNRFGIVKASTERILKLTLLISFIVAAIFFVLGEEIGYLIYKSEDIGFLLKALSPIVPFMYLDSISDGILKGLDQQGFTFRTAVSDSVIRIILILLILPLCGMKGFIGIMYFSNFFTCVLNVKRLLKVTKAKLNFFYEIIFPLISAVAISQILNLLFFKFHKFGNLAFLLVLIPITLLVYLSFLIGFKIVKKDEILFKFA